ncbi:hypothetical protein [Flavobacterium sp. CF136]|uniref:hypothetical protein n=1 Tax=Flavobacterium sp. (strain CF136) TaxID=1144313 RepID=UPI0002715261|nr:hypothetical protein [Flavobacterium sp. CF136]EJL65243.1 hypothetical protein PMI10_01436 [Flavobacterium sp. CF136]
MAKTLRINLTLDEIELLIRTMENSSSPNILKKKDRLAVKYLSHVIAQDVINVVPLNVISKGISLLTGKPQDKITLLSKLSDLGLTPTKKGQLRAYLNGYIQKQGSSLFISETEMGIVVTVEDLNRLVESKIP